MSTRWDSLLDKLHKNAVSKEEADEVATMLLTDEEFNAHLRVEEEAIRALCVECKGLVPMLSLLSTKGDDGRRKHLGVVMPDAPMDDYFGERKAFLRIGAAIAAQTWTGPPELCPPDAHRVQWIAAFFMSEAWMAMVKPGQPIGDRPSRRPDRIEIVQTNGMTLDRRVNGLMIPTGRAKEGDAFNLGETSYHDCERASDKQVHGDLLSHFWLGYTSVIGGGENAAEILRTIECQLDDGKLSDDGAKN